jgi:HEAT repeat protein
MLRFPGQAKSALMNALIDASSSIRDFARFHLRKLGEGNFAEYYRHILKESGLVPAIAALGETGTADDANLLTPFLLERPKIRAAAVRSVGQLNNGRSTSILIAALKDDHPKVAIEAKSGLERVIDAVAIADLMQVFRSDAQTHTLLAIVDLIDRKDTWAALPFLLEACGSRSSDVAAFAEGRIRSKFNRVFTAPSAAQLEAIREALNRYSCACSAELVKWFSSRR